MNNRCHEWATMQRLINKEHKSAETESNFSVRSHGTGYLVTYFVGMNTGRQARAAFAHLDGIVWDMPCSFPDPGANV